MMKSIKRMVLTGAAVMVMMSFAAPAMAADLTDYIDPSAAYTDYVSSSFDYSFYSALTEHSVMIDPPPDDTSTDCYFVWSWEC